MLAGVIFLRKTPTEKLLHELFSRLKAELFVLRETGIFVSENSRIWKCIPVLRHGVIDFSALKMLYNSPRWGSNYGCHLCTLPGRRSGRRIYWFARTPYPRRTHTSILSDAVASRNGMNGHTQMMDLFTMEQCHPDALHIISEGVTCNLFKEMFGRAGTVPELVVKREFLPDLCFTIERATNYTYASKFVLGIQDFSTTTASEKDALMFVLFPLVAAHQLCADPLGTGLLPPLVSYWILVRFVEKNRELKDEHIPVIRGFAYAMKFLWCEVSKTLFTLKTHCLLDHALIEDLATEGSPYQYSSSGFESIHRRLQLRTAQGMQCKIFYMISIGLVFVLSFVMRKEFINAMETEAKNTNNPQFLALYEKMRTAALNRMPVHVKLNSSWYVPCFSSIPFQTLLEDHQRFLLSYQRDWEFSSRMCCNGTVFSSRFYWKRRSDTTQDCVVLAEEDGVAFGIVIAFAFETHFSGSHVFLEELTTEDPFGDLQNLIRNGPGRGRLRALSALNLVQQHNKFFKRVTSSRLAIRNTFDIISPAILLHYSSADYVSRI
ncbi:hypothetical protein Aduo_018710 [Ancylostoma duodenale]